jgi:sulfide:quinone oxidoreductase
MQDRAQIVVIGAGIGGIPMAFELRDMLGRSADITVVSDTDYFHFVPSNPWVAVGWRRPKDITIALPDIFAKKRIASSSAGAKRVVPDENKIHLGDGTSLIMIISSLRPVRNSPSTR